MKNRLGILIVLPAIVGVLAVSGCGSSNSSSSGSASTPPVTKTPAGEGGSTTLKVSADANGAPAFNVTKLSAKAGKVTITMKNPSSVPHTIAIEGNGVDESGTGGAAGVGQGQESTVTASLKAGTYTYYCPVDGHKASGMQGTLTVK